METDILCQKVSRLPFLAQQEISDYVEFLTRKYYVNELQKPLAGCMKGTFTWMSDDFNAPLEDFQDYQ
jgi:hypothetical protein